MGVGEEERGALWRFGSVLEAVDQKMAAVPCSDDFESRDPSILILFGHLGGGSVARCALHADISHINPY